MIKKIGVLVVCFVMFACGDDGVSGEKYEYHFFSESELTVNTVQESYMKYGVVSQGNNLVFKYHYKAKDDEQIADDEYSEFIYFEVDANLNSFELTNEALTDAKVILTKSCFCFFGDTPEKNVEPTGIITGEKISDSKWKITLNVTFYGDETRQFDKVFVLQ